jgi:catalase
VDPAGNLAGVEEVAAAVKAAGMVPLVVAPVGGKLPNGMTVQRTFGATRSVEFDALLVAGRPAPGADAHPARDSKAGESSEPGLDPRVVLLLQESYRHAKAVGAWGAGVRALEESGVDPVSPGVVTADSAAAVFAELHEVLGSHRVWERFTPVLV